MKENDIVNQIKNTPEYQTMCSYRPKRVEKREILAKYIDYVNRTLKEFQDYEYADMGEITSSIDPNNPLILTIKERETLQERPKPLISFFSSKNAKEGKPARSYRVIEDFIEKVIKCIELHNFPYTNSEEKGKKSENNANNKCKDVSDFVFISDSNNNNQEKEKVQKPPSFLSSFGATIAFNHQARYQQKLSDSELEKTSAGYDHHQTSKNN